MSLLKPIALIASIAAVPMASYAMSLGDIAGQDEAAVQAMLEGQGYTVAEIEVEDGLIEAEAEKDGQLFEIEVDPATGAIVGLELEDEEDEDDETDNG